MSRSSPSVKAAAGVACALLLAGLFPSLGTEPTVGFQGLELFRFRDGTRQLAMRDLNGDGRDDLVFVNNRQSRMEILISRAEADGDADADPAGTDLARRFENRGMIMDQQVSVFAVGDLDGSGRPDLLTFGAALGLQLRRQAEDGSFDPPVTIYIRNPSDVVSLKLADLDDDGRLDIVLGRRDQATLLWNDPADPFLRQDRLDFADDSGAGVDILDLRDAGKPDLLLRFSQGIPFRVRLNEGNGRFGMETPLPLPPMRHLQAYTDPRFGPRIGGVLRDGVNFRLYELVTDRRDDLFSAQEITPGRIPLPGAGLKHNGAWLIRDFDENGYDDLLVSLPDSSQLALYRGGPFGLSAHPETWDTLSDVSAMSLTLGGDILVVSQRERVAALHLRDDPARFPTLLRAPGPVFAGALLPDSALRGFFICRNETNALVLAELVAVDQPMKTHALDLQVEPNGMRLFPWGEDGVGLLLFVPHASPLLYRFHEERVTKMDGSAFRAILQPLRPDHLTFLDGESGRRILVAEGRAARFYEWNGESLEIVRQLNPGLAQAQAISACPFEGSEDRNGFFVYETTASDLLWFGEESSAPARIHVQHASPDISAIRQLRNPDRDVLLFIGRRDLLQAVSGVGRLSAKPRAEYTSASENPGLRYFHPVSLGFPRRPMLALMDASNRTIELVSEDERGLKRELAFEVFQDSGFSSQSRRSETVEPREIASGDFNGDGAGDLGFLVHDNLLLYPGAR